MQETHISVDEFEKSSTTEEKQEGNNSYYFGDIKTQRNLLLAQVSQLNAAIKADAELKGIEYPELIDPQKVVRKMLKRVARAYGYQNKYDGKGNLREGLRGE